jgi:hypothetical protein
MNTRRPRAVKPGAARHPGEQSHIGGIPCLVLAEQAQVRLRGPGAPADQVSPRPG